MSVEVKLTIKFSFPHGSAKPTIGEIANFVKALDADPGQMIATYRIAEERSLFIKFKAKEAMLHCLLRNSEQSAFAYADGNVVEVRMSPAGGTVQYVRVYDLPPEVPDSDLASVLGKYGDVKRVIREKFPADLDLDMYTGVRGVYMEVKNEIPSSLHFLNRKGNIFYEGNKNLCFLCKTEGHRMNSCPQRKVRKQPVRQEHEGEKENRNEEGSSSALEHPNSGAVINGAAVGGSTVVAVTGGAQSDSSHHETAEILEEEMPEAAKEPTIADISEDESNEEENHPIYKLASHIALEIKKP